MTHEQAYERLPELAEHRLATADPELQAHIAECATCAARIQQLERVARALQTAGTYHANPPPMLTERVLAIPAEHPRRPQSRLRRRLLPAGVGLAAAASLAALVLALSGPDAPTRFEAEQTIALRPVSGQVNGTVALGRPSGPTRVVRLDVRELPTNDARSFDLWFVSDTGAMRAGSFGPGEDGRCIVDLTTPAEERFTRIVITPAGVGPGKQIIATS